MQVSSSSAPSSQQVIADEKQYVLQTYGRAPIVLSHGKGSKVYDLDGKEYTDFAAGIAVNALGHCDDRWYATLAQQAKTLAHTSNLYHSVPHVRHTPACCLHSPSPIVVCGAGCCGCCSVGVMWT